MMNRPTSTGCQSPNGADHSTRPLEPSSAVSRGRNAGRGGSFVPRASSFPST